MGSSLHALHFCRKSSSILAWTGSRHVRRRTGEWLVVLAVSIVNHLRFIFYAQRLRHLRRSDLFSDTACPTFFEIVVWIVHLEGTMRGESLMSSCTGRV